MIKLRKSILSLVTAGLLVTLSSVTAFAQTTGGQVETFDELVSKYNLEIVTTVPKEITPLKIDSIEDADLNFSSLEKTTVAKVSEDLKESDLNLNSKKNSLMTNSMTASAITSKTVTKDAGSLNSDVSLSATCTYSTDGSTIIEISSVSSRLTGNTGNWGWSQSSYTNKILDGGRTRAITVNGTLTQYVYINGQTVKYNTSKSGYFEIYK